MYHITSTVCASPVGARAAHAVVMSMWWARVREFAKQNKICARAPLSAHRTRENDHSQASTTQFINDPPAALQAGALLGFPLRDSAAARTAGAARTSGCTPAGGPTRIRGAPSDPEQR